MQNIDKNFFDNVSINMYYVIKNIQKNMYVNKKYVFNVKIRFDNNQIFNKNILFLHDIVYEIGCTSFINRFEQ